MLPEREQRFLKTRTLRAIVISVDSHPRMKFEISPATHKSGRLRSISSLVRRLNAVTLITRDAGTVAAKISMRLF